MRTRRPLFIIVSTHPHHIPIPSALQILHLLPPQSPLPPQVPPLSPPHFTTPSRHHPISQGRVSPSGPTQSSSASSCRAPLSARPLARTAARRSSYRWGSAGRRSAALPDLGYGGGRPHAGWRRGGWGCSTLSAPRWPHSLRCTEPQWEKENVVEVCKTHMLSFISVSF